MEELHWYCFSYIGGHANGHTGTVSGSTYSGFTFKKITLKIIKDNKANANMNDDAVVVSISYLGLMTREEFTEGNDE